MSAVSLASAAVQQLRTGRRDTAARAAGVPPPAPPVPPPSQSAITVDSALSVLTTYIPAEATALYLAFVSASPQIIKDCQWLSPMMAYFFFLLAVSPGLFVLAYFAKLAANNDPFPDPKDFPWFRLASSIIAFGVWALCIPGNPFSNDKKPGWGILYGLIAIGLSVVLPAIEAIYQWIQNNQRRTS